MKKNLPAVNAWLNLRQLLDAVRDNTEFKDVDERSQRLLEWIFQESGHGRPLYVQNRKPHRAGGPADDETLPVGPSLGVGSHVLIPVVADTDRFRPPFVSGRALP